MTSIDIERGWSIWPKADPANEDHPHRNLCVHVTECSGAVILEIAGDSGVGEEHTYVSAVLTEDEWGELTSLPVRSSDARLLALDDHVG